MTSRGNQRRVAVRTLEFGENATDTDPQIHSRQSGQVQIPDRFVYSHILFTLRLWSAHIPNITTDIFDAVIEHLQDIGWIVGVGTRIFLHVLIVVCSP